MTTLPKGWKGGVGGMPNDLLRDPPTQEAPARAIGNRNSVALAKIRHSACVDTATYDQERFALLGSYD